MSEKNWELIEDIQDVKEKLEDCLETLKQGKELDGMQDAFLRMYTIIE